MNRTSNHARSSDELASALEQMAGEGRRIRDDWHLPWSRTVQQAVQRMQFDTVEPCPPLFVAVVGGASSGKSTVFNNLLDGQLVSRITARGHTTIGPILAVHEQDRSTVESFLEKGLLLPDVKPVLTELGESVTGDPRSLVIVHHEIDALAGVLLFDTPDFTSEAALQEGDVAMALLPWFDKLLVVVDHERWFDRQSISDLRVQSVRFDLDRFVLFNRTREGTMAESDKSALAKQAERLAATDMSVLEFRRGRGFCQFAPGALDKALAFLGTPKRERCSALKRQVAQAASQVLNQNEERAARLEELNASLSATVERVTPSVRECMTALMMPDERKQLEVASRVLRVQETTEWIRSQQKRLRAALGAMPVFGSLIRPAPSTLRTEPAELKDRASLAESYYETLATKSTHEIHWAVSSSTFWDEIRRWTGMEPAQPLFAWTQRQRDDIRDCANSFDQALQRWSTKVESECQGIAPHVQGAIGIGAIAFAIVLVAAPGPVAALTLVSAKGALAAAIGKLAAATGAGALAGKHAGRLTSVIREKLVGSQELNAVHKAAEAFRHHVEAHARNQVAQALSEASRLVMHNGHTLVVALETLAQEPTQRP